MCKAANEPGGPRRCAGDARDRLAHSMVAVQSLERRYAKLAAALRADPAPAPPLAVDATGGNRAAPMRATGNTDAMDWKTLATVPLSYAETGATAARLPAGYHHIEREQAIGAGEDLFEEAAAKLMNWQVQRSAGVFVDASQPVAQAGAIVVVGTGPVHGACRVVYVINEPNRRGFAYGTLEGHPESGEEFFGVRLDPQTGIVYAQVRAFSRPGQWWTRATAPIASVVQERITKRYLNALAADAK